jgi:DNA-binding MarR family transcriptional regulator
LSRETFHPNAYIPSIKNKKAGLKARSLILNSLIETPLKPKDLCLKTGLSSSTLHYHLKLLEKHNLIRRRKISKRRFMIERTGLGQKQIQNFT